MMRLRILERLGGTASPVRKWVAKAWRRLVMRDLGGTDNHRGLDRLYALPDPWDMASAREQSRFVQTNDLILSLFGPVDTMLEVGCGEGHQSAHLVQICRQLDAIDVSATAVARAGERVPGIRAAAADLSTLPWPLPATGRYDVVVACEVLYYMSDIPDAIDRMSRLGRHGLVTFFAPAARVVAAHVEQLPGVRRGWIHHGGQAWLWAAWSAPTDVSADGPIGPVI
ncbi:MAG: class I SAM-dependent DNA methyltransferase [Aquabacterium sp.]